MSLTFNTESSAANEMLVSVPASFDFSSAREFLRKIRNIPDNKLPAVVHFDFSTTEYIDTAGLGTLLLLGDSIGAKCTIKLSGARGNVHGLLQIAGIEERLGRIRPPPVGFYDLKPCASCGQTADGRCGGSILNAAQCQRTQRTTSVGLAA